MAYGPKPAGDCIRFIMLTGCRPGEAMTATWEQFDAEPGFWIKPSAQTKQRKIHKAPLGPAALELLARIRTDRGGGNFVFPGRVRGEPLKHLNSAWKKISGPATVSLWADSHDKKIATLISDLETGLGRRPTVAECRSIAAQRGVKLCLTDVRIYDLRHTFASIGAGGGLRLQIIGRLLGHTQFKTTLRYAHLAGDPLREAASKIVTQIPGAGKSKAEIVPLPKRGGVA